MKYAAVDLSRSFSLCHVYLSAELCLWSVLSITRINTRFLLICGERGRHYRARHKTRHKRASLIDASQSCHLSHFYQFLAKLSTEREISHAAGPPPAHPATRRYMYRRRAGTPSSTKAGSEEELVAFTSPSFATIFLPSAPSAPTRVPLPRAARLSPRPPPPAPAFLSSDFPHSIFAISTSDIENSQGGGSAA